MFKINKKRGIFIMKIKFILPALEEAKSPYWRPIKYSLFPPLGLATLASLCDETDEIEIVDEHVEEVNLDDEPDLVCIESYITNSYRAYQIADTYRSRGIKVAIGGIHATSLPNEAKKHADSVLLGLGERSFPEFLKDFKEGKIKPFYEQGQVSLDDLPLPRRDLLKNEKYLVQNSMTFSRGCPNRCSFCYVSSFYKGGKSFFTYKVDRILEEIESMKGRHLYFLDDNIFADKKLVRQVFMEHGYNKAYKDFYKWGNIVKTSKEHEEHEELRMKMKHLAYAGAWKKFEPVWNFLIKNELLSQARGGLVRTLR